MVDGVQLVVIRGNRPPMKDSVSLDWWFWACLHARVDVVGFVGGVMPGVGYSEFMEDGLKRKHHGTVSWDGCGVGCGLVRIPRIREKI